MQEPHTIKTTCSMCGYKTTHTINYTGMRCKKCNIFYDPFDITRGNIAQERRSAMKLTRKQIALKLGYKTASVKYYELVICSKPYYIATQKLFKKFVKQQDHATI